MYLNEFLYYFCGQSYFWNYDLSWNTTSPMLTRCFHSTILVWIPTIFLTLSALFEINYIIKAKRKYIKWNHFNLMRLILVSACFFINFIILIYFLINHKTISAADFLGVVLRLVSFAFLGVCLFFHRLKGINTSGRLWIYLFLETLSFLPIYLQIWTNTLFYDDFERICYLLYYPVLVGLIILFSFADNPSEYYDKSKFTHPEYTASFINIITFWYFNNLAYAGFRRNLTKKDIWPSKEDMKIENLVRQYEKYSKEKLPSDFDSIFYKEKKVFIGKKDRQQHKQNGVIFVFTKMFRLYMLGASLLKLLHDIIQLVNSQFLKLLILFVKKGSSEPLWHGFVIIIAMFSAYALQTFCLAIYFDRMMTIGVKMKSVLMAQIYKKSLILSNAARKTNTVGKIENLMVVDTQKFLDLMPFINSIWSSPFQIVGTTYLLYQELGYSVFFGVAIMIIMIPLNGIVAGVTKKIQTEQMKHKDKRLKFINQFFTGIKIIKLYSWEESFIETVMDARNKELVKLKHFSYWNALSSFLWLCAPFFVCLTTFAVYVTIQGGILTAEKAFVSIALFNLLRFPLTMMPQVITWLILAMVSVQRINDFLNSPELDPYVTRNEEIHAVVIEDGTFIWTNEGKDQTSSDKKKMNAKEKNKLKEKNFIKEKEDAEVNEMSSLLISTPQLVNINFTLEKGSFVAIVGSVGSGKSSLISAILGEMERINGRVNICGSLKTAYIPQQAWIMNSSLRENILFGSPFEFNRYKQIIECCALKPDLEILPAGDSTEIGEKGINLSGGQKQRVSLARACYNNADLYFLDDPLSAVDAHVSKYLFDNVLSSKRGLLKDKTRFLVTNKLDILPKVDKIILMKDGKIDGIGSYKELITINKNFSDLIKQFTTEDQKNYIERKESVSEATQQVRSFERGLEIDKKLIEDEKLEIGGVKRSIYINYFKMLSVLWLSFIIIGAFCGEASAALSNFWLADWSAANENVADTYSTNTRISVYSLLILIKAFLSLALSYGIVKGSLILSNTVHRTLLESISMSPMSFFDTTPIGRIINRFSKDMDTLDTALPNSLRSWLICFVAIISCFVIITYTTPIFVTALVPICIIYYIIQCLYIPCSRQLKRLESVTRSPIFSHFIETLAGVNSIRAFNAKDMFINESFSRIDENQRCYYCSLIANRWLGVRLEFCGNFIILFAAIFAVLAKDKLHSGYVGLSLSSSFLITQTLNWLVRMSAEMETNIVSLERIIEYCNVTKEKGYFKDEMTIIPPKNWPSNGKISFEKYSARYREGLNLILKEIDFIVYPNEKIGIVGRTGSGKTSLTLGLFRIIEPASGRILIDDIDISKLTLKDLRSNIAIIPQDSILFTGTLRFNIDPFNRFTDDEIWNALEQAHLKPFVNKLDNGLMYFISEEGSNLSVGQKQLVCLARALLKKPKILVLDEATAAVDMETDTLIQSTIRSQFKDCTILTIAHRLNTILDSDRVLVLDEGKIVEIGIPSNLIKDKNSLFYSLAEDAGLV